MPVNNIMYIPGEKANAVSPFFMPVKLNKESVWNTKRRKRRKDYLIETSRFVHDKSKGGVPMAKKRLWVLVLMLLLFLLGAVLISLFVLSGSGENVYRNARLVQGPKVEQPEAVEAYLRLEETLK